MTDTPRTQAELLALFPNNHVRAINPQDMRDLVVSVMVPPSYDLVSQATVGSHAAISVPNGLNSGVSVPLDEGPYLHDPQGWINTDPFDYYTTTYEPGTAVILPAGGVYAVQLKGFWDTNTTGDRFVTITNVDERIEQPGQTLDTWLGDPNYGSFIDGEAQQSATRLTNKFTYLIQTVTALIKTEATYFDSRWTTYVAHNAGSALDLKGWQVDVHQIGRMG
jgi:hypothetical protein